MPVRDAPVPILATITAPLVLTVTFSHLILPAVLDVPNWTGRWNNQAMSVQTVAVVAGAIQIAFLPGIAFPGPDVITYSPPPFDVISDTFKPTPADAFADFPIT